MEKPTVKISVRIYESDLEALRSFYSSQGGYNHVIRKLVNLHVRALEQKAQEKLQELSDE